MYDHIKKLEVKTIKELPKDSTTPFDINIQLDPDLTKILNAQPPITKAQKVEIESMLSDPIPDDLLKLWKLS